MLIKIDSRERDLEDEFKQMSVSFRDDMKYVTQQLSLGDIIICDDDGTEKIIIERKTLYDLAASIKDGRYAEQSFRLNNYDIHNHNIVYLIEGDMNRYNTKKGRMDKSALYSAMTTLMYYKGFSVVRSNSLMETCTIIVSMASKILKHPNKESFYSANKAQDSSEKNYCHVVKKVKKDNITEENIGEIMLSQIPNVSTTSAIAIMKKFASIGDLMAELKKNPNCLDGTSFMTSTGQQRKISKKCIENVCKFLMR